MEKYSRSCEMKYTCRLRRLSPFKGAIYIKAVECSSIPWTHNFFRSKLFLLQPWPSCKLLSKPLARTMPHSSSSRRRWGILAQQAIWTLHERYSARAITSASFHHAIDPLHKFVTQKQICWIKIITQAYNLIDNELKVLLLLIIQHKNVNQTR